MADLRKKTKVAEWEAQHPGAFHANAADLVEEAPKRPSHGDTWGKWRLDTNRRVMEFHPEGGSWAYEFDLEESHDPCSLLDFILEVNTKAWASAEDIGDFVEALNDLVGNARTVFCPFGQPMTASPWTLMARSPDRQAE